LDLVVEHGSFLSMKTFLQSKIFLSDFTVQKIYRISQIFPDLGQTKVFVAGSEKNRNADPPDHLSARSSGTPSAGGIDTPFFRARTPGSPHAACSGRTLAKVRTGSRLFNYENRTTTSLWILIGKTGHR
jgi:hypothetical protein